MKATTTTTSSTTNTKTSTITTTSTTTGTTSSQVSTSPRDLYPSHVPVVCQQTTTGITRKLVFLPPFLNIALAECPFRCSTTCGPVLRREWKFYLCWLEQPLQVNVEYEY